MKLATKASAGAASSSAAAPSWSILPVDDHADAVRERGRVLEVVRDEQRRQPELGQQLGELAADDRARVGVQRGERLVEQQDRRVARERPRERDPLPLTAGEVGRPAPARCEIRKRSSSSSTRSRPPKPTLRRTSRCGKSAYSWKTSPTERRSGGRSTPASVSSQTAAPSATLPRSGRSRPAIARSTLDFPAPDGPTSASVSRPSDAV